MKTINIKFGRPEVSTALIRIANEIVTAKREGHKAIKIIHGYGASGEGGAIKPELHKWLEQNSKMYGIKLIIRGEDFKRSNALTITALERLPNLKTDEDYGKSNEGVTVIIL